eukprot:9886107-Lingulodinium_polyedra.AAC.1
MGSVMWMNSARPVLARGVHGSARDYPCLCVYVSGSARCAQLYLHASARGLAPNKICARGRWLKPEFCSRLL